MTKLLSEVELESHEESQRSWLARVFFPTGQEPDPRFTLANERTFLAWTRTSLALLAGGISLKAFPLDNIDPVAQSFLAVLVVLVGMLIALGAAVRWIKVERSMRSAKPLPIPAIMPFLAVVVAMASALTLWSLVR